MHARQLVEIAGWICANSEVLLDGGVEVSDDALAEYWIASRCRLDRWGRALRRPSGAGHTAVENLVALADEIVLSDVLSRAVAALTLSVDRATDEDERSAIGKNVLDAHKEALHRVRALATRAWPRDSPAEARRRSLARRSARWTDALLSFVGRPEDTRRFAYSSRRVGDLARDRAGRGPTRAKAAAALVMLSIRVGLSDANRQPVCGDLNRRIGGVALALYGERAFDGFGLPRSAWMIRVERSAEDAVAMLGSITSEPTGPADVHTHRWWV